ncbi:hypothetical protein SAMN02745146_0359 [Hymenobacter daecheongensis DSM 21074]|uniref:Antitoxin VbhA domain-containing protein n=1 Tax=Hymenobacter daecheongensis DSM 21074 TaxID=1121955 RepID=A0A1M6MQC6_9BACT|nr:antitoxin VbhA family protein [Hymenobacter daecheongensis]SHJ85493.1 hypothetical protein SAMN02745146_0359 [Hymenobacter daecheongensis DSM 21074]
MSYTPSFSENEQTPAQRLDTVQFALGVSATAGGQASAESVQLYERYILGEIDLAYIGAAVREMYPQYPSNDPYAKYAPGEGPHVEPAPLVEAVPGFEDKAAEEEAPAGPEVPAAVCVAQLRAFVQEIAEHQATQPPRQRYIQIDV